MTQLSVNINKVATLRNSRGGNLPDLLLAAKRIQSWGADGITVHPRPDERHIRYADVQDLKEVVDKEFNIEGNPKHRPFVDLVLETKPDQVTLVPDSQSQLTSDHGWDLRMEMEYLKDLIPVFKKANIRVSIFLDPSEEMVKMAAETGCDRIELYTESYAQKFSEDKELAIRPFVIAAEKAKELGLGINAGHDLNLENLGYLKEQIPFLDEVSIGHALISDALYLGLQNTVEIYKRTLEK